MTIEPHSIRGKLSNGLPFHVTIYAHTRELALQEFAHRYKRIGGVLPQEGSSAVPVVTAVPPTSQPIHFHGPLPVVKVRKRKPLA